MIGIVLASHGRLAKEMLNSAEMIMGPQENIIALALEPNDDPMKLKESIKESVEKVTGDEGVIVLVDLMGGSPSNAAAYVAKEGIPVITGMNLSILLELIGMRYSMTDELIQNIIEAGKEGIIDIREIFRGLN
ncbi:PTS sugar transporter subunit IIA [Wukongibacter baidiensis]|uniref:PTS sugar transporter subunit IIA n=1 Tax=Wukongibacter baidiensis TaxID=1723361 RepID=UPI003D7F6041